MSLTLKKSYDVVIVGAGIMGLNTAFQLKRRSPSLKIALLEKSPQLGSGSSGMSSAILRSYYSLKPMCVFSKEGINLYKHWKDYVRIEEPKARFVPFTGSVWSWGRYKTREAVEEDLVRLRSAGIEAHLTDAKGVLSEWPALSGCGEVLDAMGTVEHECKDGDLFVVEKGTGYFDPSSALDDLRDACVREGVEVHMNTTPNDVHSAGGKVQGLNVHGVDVSTPVVINCAGPWCNKVNQMVGIELPFTLVPTRIPVLYRTMPQLISMDHCHLPHMCDMPGGVYFRPHLSTGQLLISTALEEDEKEQVDPDQFNSSLDPGYRTKLLNAMHHRLPKLDQTTTNQVTGMSGMYTMCKEDVHPIIGQTKLKGYYVANGFSGHGFKCAPSVGSILAQKITGIKLADDTTIDMEFFSPYRDPHKLPIKNVFA